MTTIPPDQFCLPNSMLLARTTARPSWALSLSRGSYVNGGGRFDKLLHLPGIENIIFYGLALLDVSSKEV